MDDRVANPSRSKGLVLLAVVFLLGMICGASLFHLGQRSVRGFPAGRPAAFERAERRPGFPRGGPSERFFDQLGLDAEQKDRVASILHESRTRMHSLLEESRVEIRDLLTEEQQEKLDRLRPPRRGRGRSWGKGPPPPPRGEAE